MFLRQSTSQVIRFGPFLDSTDGVTAETALTIAQADMQLSKDGAAFAQKNTTGNATHDADGWYSTTLDTTDTATVGELYMQVNVSGALPVWVRYWVIEESTYDALYGAAAAGFNSSGLVTLAAVTHTGAVIPTVTTLTGHTAQTGDSFARLGAPAGVSISADIADVPTVAEFNARTLLAADYFDPVADAVATVTNLTNLPTIPANWITAAGITAGALNGKGDWNIGKTGYSLTQAFPANFADLSISATTGLVDITQTAADKAWSTTTRILTANTNLNDPTAAAIADAVWDELLSGHVISGSAGEALSAAGTAGDPWTTALPGAYGAGTAGKIIGDNIDAVLSTLATSSALAAAQTDLDTITGTDGVTLATAQANYAPATAASVAALNDIAATDIVSNGAITTLAGAVVNVDLVDTCTTNTDMRGTDSAALASVCTEGRLSELDAANIPADLDNVLTDTATTIPAQITALNDISVSDILTTQMTESYAADGVAPTLAQALHLIQQSIGDFAISGTTLTVKKLDGATTAATYTLDSDTSPTSKTRAS